MYLKHNEISYSDQQKKYVQKLAAKPEIERRQRNLSSLKNLWKDAHVQVRVRQKMRLLSLIAHHAFNKSIKQFATLLYFNSIFFRTQLLTMSSSVQLWLVSGPICRCDECDADRTRVDLTKAATSAVIWFWSRSTQTHCCNHLRDALQRQSSMQSKLSYKIVDNLLAFVQSSRTFQFNK